MKTKEEILNKHFKKEYGFKIDSKRMPSFKYMLDAMEEYKSQSDSE